VSGAARMAWALGLAVALSACAPSRRNLAFPGGDGAWRASELWRDGKAEKCVYAATRVIYGAPRSYRAIAYTNVENYDAATTTKSDGGGREVFKHHWSEIVPTENYDYRFSTCTYSDAQTLAAVKLTVGTQEDCGASFKQVWLSGANFVYWDSVYFPGAGVRSGELGEASQLHFADELALLLRDYDFRGRPSFELNVVRSQRSTRQVPFEPVAARVSYIAQETLELRAGALEAHHLRAQIGDETCDYWFAAQARAPWMHALVRYEDSSGVRFELVEMLRTAYWERG
jgi:hypothetical protein